MLIFCNNIKTADLQCFHTTFMAHFLFSGPIGPFSYAPSHNINGLSAVNSGQLLLYIGHCCSRHQQTNPCRAHAEVYIDLLLHNSMIKTQSIEKKNLPTQTKTKNNC